jgi:hypothetical protein
VRIDVTKKTDRDAIVELTKLGEKGMPGEQIEGLIESMEKLVRKARRIEGSDSM